MGSWKKASVDKKGTIICYSTGKRCFVTELSPGGFRDFFAVPRNKSVLYDKHLADTAGKINSLLEEVQKSNKSKSEHLAFLMTEKGIVLAWCNDFVELEDKTEEEVSEILGL
jgi:hypothetical protein